MNQDLEINSKKYDCRGLLSNENKYSEDKSPVIDILITEDMTADAQEPHKYDFDQPGSMLQKDLNTSPTVTMSSPGLSTTNLSQTSRQMINPTRSTQPTNVPNQAAIALRNHQQRQAATFRRRAITYLRSITDIEPKLTLVRAFGFCSMLCILSFPLMFVKPDEPPPYRAILSTIYCYLIYNIFENAIRTLIPQRKRIKRHEDVFAALDAFGGLLFLASVDLRIHNVFSSITFVPCVFGHYCIIILCLI